jgi:hypothetical protein
MSASLPSPTRNSIRDIAIKMARYCGVREWRFTRRDNDGRAYVFKKIIETADPITVDRLYVVAHECGHIALQHGPRNLWGHRNEFEAEQFAILVLRHFDVPVPYDMVEDGQHYVAWHIEQDVHQHGRREIDGDAYDWAARYVLPAIRHAVNVSRIPLTEFQGQSQYQRMLGDFLSVFSDGLRDEEGNMEYRNLKRIDIRHQR